MSYHAETSSVPEARRLRFGQYTLDCHRGCLFIGGTEVALRPKTFALLHYFIQNPERLIPKDELFRVLWPNLNVTDDALVQSIGELRKVLGDDGSKLITTVPRRGYRFEATVNEQAIERGYVEPLQTKTQSAAVAIAKPTIANHWKIYAIAAATFVLVGVLGLFFLTATKLFDPESNSYQATKAAVSVAGKPTIAVLPFVNQSDEPPREYFADGLTQDIIDALGRFPELTVMSWNAIASFKGKVASPQEITRIVGVRYQVEGLVRQVADRIRVTARLVDDEGRVLWSGNFDEAFADIFALQERLVAHVAGALVIRLTQSEQKRSRAKPTDRLDAYDYMLRSRPALQRPSRENIADARVLLRRAIELDPNYAAAYAALAETYHIAIAMGWAESPRAFLGRAEELASRALSIDDAEVRARVILGRIHLFFERYDQARTEIDRAVAINPSDAHALAGRGNILLWSGETDAAINSLELARRIDPELNAIDRNALSLAYYLKRRYEAAIEQAEINLRTTAAANFTRVILAAALAQLNRSDEAAQATAVIRRLDPAFNREAFGTKFLRPSDLEHLREGMHKAGL